MNKKIFTALLTTLLLLSLSGSAMCLPESFDWRNVNGTNYVTPVRSQSSCGACTIFAAVAALESNILREHPHITNIDLSEHFYVSDCHTEINCAGSYDIGYAISPLEYLGIPCESCDPYIAANGQCICCKDWQDNGWMIEDRTNLGYCSTNYYKTKLMETGPLPAEILLSDWHDPVSGYQAYHAVLIVGWNDSEGVWIAKNSYGTGWGNDGYGTILFDRLGKASRTVYSVSGAIRIYTTYPADITGDKCVNEHDIQYALDCWGHYESPADISGENYGIPDLTVDVYDLVYIIDNWGCCSCGDITNDGNVNMGDVVMLSDYVTYGTPIIDERDSDVNSDGNINILDVMILSDYVTYGTPELNCMCQ